jgi:hypothetical protein
MTSHHQAAGRASANGCLWPLTILFAIGLSARTASGVADVHLEFEPAAPTFGVIDRVMADDLTIEVTVHNRSDEAFDLRGVTVGCGCMTARVVKPGLIEPGERGTVRITLDHKKARVGPATYPLTIFDGADPVASAKVAYEYDPPVLAESPELFVDAEGGETAATSTTLWVRRPGADAGGPPLVECDSGHFRVALSMPPAPAPGQYQLDVSCNPRDLPIGTSAANITISLAGSSKPDLIIPVHSTVRAPVSVRPPTVLLKELTAGGEVRRTLRLTSSKPFAVKAIASSSVEPADGGGQVGRAPQDGAAVERCYEVVVRPAAAGSAGTFEAEIRVSIESPVAFELVVPVVGEIVVQK